MANRATAEESGEPPEPCPNLHGGEKWCLWPNCDCPGGRLDPEREDLFDE